MKSFKFGAIKFKSKSSAVLFIAKKYNTWSQMDIAKKISGKDTAVLNSNNVIVHLVLKKNGLLRKQTMATAM